MHLPSPNFSHLSNTSAGMRQKERKLNTRNIPDKMDIGSNSHVPTEIGFIRDAETEEKIFHGYKATATPGRQANPLSTVSTVLSQESINLLSITKMFSCNFQN
jgi:hypothetical protein